LSFGICHKREAAHPNLFTVWNKVYPAESSTSQHWLQPTQSPPSTWTNIYRGAAPHISHCVLRIQLPRLSLKTTAFFPLAGSRKIGSTRQLDTSLSKQYVDRLHLIGSCLSSTVMSDCLLQYLCCHITIVTERPTTRADQPRQLHYIAPSTIHGTHLDP